MYVPIFNTLYLLVFFQAFELVTGDYLFEPHSGDDYSRDEGTYLLFHLNKKKKSLSINLNFAKTL